MSAAGIAALIDVDQKGWAAVLVVDVLLLAFRDVPLLRLSVFGVTVTETVVRSWLPAEEVP